MLVIRSVDLGIWKKEPGGGPFRKLYVEPKETDIYTFSDEDIETALIEFLVKRGYDDAARGRLVYSNEDEPEIEVTVK